MRKVVAVDGVPTEDGEYRIHFYNDDLNPLVRNVRIAGSSYKVLPDGGLFDIQGCMRGKDTWEKIGE